MLDLLLDLTELSRSILLGLLRSLWWLGWEFCVRTVGWSIGWLALRTITAGQFPKEGIKQLDDVPWLRGVLTEILGLGLLATTIYVLSQAWPGL